MISYNRLNCFFLRIQWLEGVLRTTKTKLNFGHENSYFWWEHHKENDCIVWTSWQHWCVAGRSSRRPLTGWKNRTSICLFNWNANSSPSRWRLVKRIIHLYNFNFMRIVLPTKNYFFVCGSTVWDWCSLGAVLLQGLSRDSKREHLPQSPQKPQGPLSKYTLL